eukprot:CAMPEP_0184679328 /NCGR_PEP_ID=MMETSP0312-20130426/2163_1 /TAXON_ID=31354 /ORGANISM="Compsopogon coeruleus, Strain SAG 36.94" /LENGTH=961 /DNA_ID=CAMNT_0027128705 /DNA_START=228 /DNA_END=3113 /DNA_ORIENTATION=+
MAEQSLVRLNDRIRMRAEEIERLPVELPEDFKERSTREARMLRLVDLQRTVRSQVVAEMQALLHAPHFSQLEYCSRWYHRAVPETSHARLGIRNEKRHRMEQEERRHARHLAHLAALMEHVERFRQHYNEQYIQQKKLARDIEKHHSARARDEERKRKKEQQERLRALRENDEEQYFKLVQDAKNDRLLHLINQTDDYLRQIGAQIEKQKEAARAADGQREQADEDQPQVANSEDDKDDNKNSLQAIKSRRNEYYKLSHTIEEEVHQPEMLVGGTLKAYQMEGLQWLISLYNNNLNGILADEMGLGKTIQTIALLSYLYEVKENHGPFLIIVPLSTISNWVRELEAWAPKLTKVVYRGDISTRKQIFNHEILGSSFSVLLTTYEYVVKDKHILGRVEWKYIIIDEGHRMKNSDCKLALTLGAKYTSRNRLLLTGTPLQNNLTELWALLNFLLPSIFKSSETFQNWFSAPFQSNTLGNDSADLSEEETLLVINRLHQVLRPFLLRRLKIDVEAQLPEKVEKVLRCGLSAWQKVLYRQVRNKIAVATGDNMAARAFNNIIMQLKKICNHPYLFYHDDELFELPRNMLVRSSGKFDLLRNMLVKLKATNHKTLIFSQMTSALDQLERLMDFMGIRFLRLDGMTKADDRQEMLELFNAPNSPYFCFLLSTRAGGLGLNLQSADTVVIFDSDWNPMMDLQAQDRAHRIGQTNEVRVFRLVCSGTVEEHILQRANEKLQMDAQIIQAGKFNNKSSEKDRREFLKDLFKKKDEDDEDEPSDVVYDDELNRWLARSEEEEELFATMDSERVTKEGDTLTLMWDESELPQWVLAPEKEAAAASAAASLPEDLGRGRRNRKTVFYDDALTEREWLALVDRGGDPSEASSIKRSKKSRKRRGSESLIGEGIDSFNEGSGRRKAIRIDTSNDPNSTDDEQDLKNDAGTSSKVGEEEESIPGENGHPEPPEPSV